MPKSPPDGTPRVCPYLLYEDLDRAIAWLDAHFGLRERANSRVRNPEGKAVHTEMEVGSDGLVMMGGPGPGWESPNRSGSTAIQLYVYVDDVDAHHRHAADAGASIIDEPADTPYGDRRYAAADLDGHVWYFATHVRDVDPSEWNGTGGGSSEDGSTGA